ncbi:MAG: 5-methyltetrahydropteroyltriglutamate--homocysteine S-methyltransferase [Oscillospiraceae bacterium]
MEKNNLRAPFRYDIVGSFLRPQELKDARAEYGSGAISIDELKEIEDRCIVRLIRKEKEIGLHAITDGEFRRQAWHLDFMWGFEGVAHTPTKTGLPFHGEQAMIDDTYLVGRIRPRAHHPFVDHFRFVKQFEDENTVAKLTIPAPAQFYAQMAMPFALANTKKVYSDLSLLREDLVSAYKAFIQEVYDAGCRNLQIDDCTWGMLVDDAAPKFFGTDVRGLEEVKRTHLLLNNAVLDGLPEDLVVNTHVCRGNYHSTYANRGPYNRVAGYLLAKENVNAFYLEFDDERSGSFNALRGLAPGKKVVLGLVTTKSPVLEDKEVLKKRIQDAAQYVPLDQLYLSPQCGFASCEIGNKLTEEQQWAKISLVKETAEEVWKDA